MDRRVLSFVVVLREATERRSGLWLGIEGKAVKTEELAVRFALHASPTPGEKIRIEMLQHDIAGGLDKWNDLAAGLDALRFYLREKIGSRLWPEGRPEPETDEEEEAQDQALQRAFFEETGPRREQFDHLSRLGERIAFMARWPVLVLDPTPPGWRTLADREGLDERTFQAIQSAFHRAQAQADQGK